MEDNYFIDINIDGEMEVYQSHDCYNLSACNLDGGPINSVRVVSDMIGPELHDKYKSSISRVVDYITD